MVRDCDIPWNVKAVGPLENVSLRNRLTWQRGGAAGLGPAGAPLFQGGRLTRLRKPPPAPILGATEPKSFCKSLQVVRRGHGESHAVR